MALPDLTRTLDDDFVNTWYEIRPEVIDNILSATVFFLALKEYGCLTPQVGGEYITRTVGYGTKSTQVFQKGTVLSQSEPALDTMARWDWRRFAMDVNRSLVDDQKNAGKFKIKSYISRRLEAARDSIVQDMETDLLGWGVYVASPYRMNGILDICASTSGESTQYGATGGTTADTNSDAYTSGTQNGNINRSNSWWRNKVKTGTAPASLNLVADMRTFFNTVSNNQESPNFILADQDLYEYYEDDVSDRQQIVRSAFNKTAADLGFDTLTFKGATLAWSDKLAATDNMYFLNMNHIELVYDPNYWFDMTEWKSTANQLERVAYIVCVSPGLITGQPRRHGILEY
jgi:hypothetical protein